MRAIVAAGLLPLIALLSTPVRSDPPTGEVWTRVESLSDEFNGTQLDSAKWHALNPKWLGRLPSRFASENVSVRDGRLIIRGTKISPDDALAKESLQFKTGTIKSQQPIKYGYFEISAHIAKSKISSAFWLYDHSPVTWTEIDVFELCGLPPCSADYNTNAHARVVTIAGANPEEFRFFEKRPTADLVSGGAVVAALEWNPNFLRWYANGKKIREIENLYWHDPLFVVLDSEVFVHWFGRPDDKELPSEFSVDYIRVWQKAE